MAVAVVPKTGTFLGKTTEHLIKHSDYVVSIEPSVDLYNKVLSRLKSRKVLLLNGTSEDKLQEAIDNVTLKKFRIINFWLDGHFSSGITFQGEQSCPLVSELDLIEKNIESKKIIQTELNIYIDDLRLICNASNLGNNETEGYPDLKTIFNHPLVLRSKISIDIDIIHLQILT